MSNINSRIESHIPRVSLKRPLLVTWFFTIAVYAAIMATTTGQFRSEMLAVAYISFGVPITGMLLIEWLHRPWSDRWSILGIIIRGLFIISLLIIAGAAAWLFGQMQRPYDDSNFPANHIGRWFQPYQYCAINLGALSVFIAGTALKDGADLRAIFYGLLAAGTLAFLLLWVLVFFHAQNAL